MKVDLKHYSKILSVVKVTLVAFITLLYCTVSHAAVTLEQEVKVTDKGLFFDGDKKTVTQSRNSRYVQGQKYDYAYGRSIVPHGDAIKVYKNYVFMTWYRGGIGDRHVMLTRYNMKTGTQKTIQFPHRHTGFEGRWWIGETHNTIAVGISPKDETIHLLYDMHAYHSNTATGGNGSFKNDYFRYSYSVAGAATVPDNEFKLTQFVKDTGPKNEGNNDYKHFTMTGAENHKAFSRLTYPSFFLNAQGDLFMHMRQGSSHDGSIVFNKYNPSQSKWGNFKRFNVMGAGNKGEVKNWSIYGIMKFEDGKIRIGFQRRMNQPNKFRANEGMYYAYSDDPSGATQWKDYRGELITMPLVKAEEILVFDPSTLMPEATARNQVSITGGFDWTVTDNGDVHLIGRTGEYKNGKTVRNIYSHTFQKGGEGSFVTKTDFPSASEIYSAGNNIYIIGLENSRPFVERAPGGTNDFTRVYQAPSTSKKFEKGVVHIHEGKLFYYLLERGTGDTRTTYLQIIDLDIDSSDQPVDEPVDPPVNTPINNPPEGFKFAVNAKEFLPVDRPVDIAFGAQDSFVFFKNRRTGVTCANSMCTRDPIPGVKKACYTREAKTPYGETYNPVPGIIEAEHYDYGGQNVSYSDSSPELNKGAVESNFRMDEGVDLAAGNGGVVMSWIGNGEWVEYSMYVHRAGDYDVSFVTSSESDDGEITMSLDGEILAPGIDIMATGDWAQYEKSTSRVFLPEGYQVIRLTFDQGRFNLDKVIFEEVSQ